MDVPVAAPIADQIIELLSTDYVASNGDYVSFAIVAKQLCEVALQRRTSNTSDHTASYIDTADPELESKTGHSRNVLDRAIRAGKLNGTKTSKRGYRVALADVAAWSKSRRDGRGRKRTVRSPSEVAPKQPDADAIARNLLSTVAKPRIVR